MQVPVLVVVDISLGDEDLGDPAPGDPLEKRMEESAIEAVGEAVTSAMERGFNHDMQGITYVLVDEIRYAELYR